MEMKLDRHTAWRHPTDIFVLPDCRLLAGHIHRHILPMRWWRWPPAAPRLNSTTTILGTHRMTREGVFPESFSRSHWDSLSSSSSLWPRRCSAHMGGVWASPGREGTLSLRKLGDLPKVTRPTQVRIFWPKFMFFWVTVSKLFLGNQCLFMSSCEPFFSSGRPWPPCKGSRFYRWGVWFPFPGPFWATELRGCPVPSNSLFLILKKNPILSSKALY